MSEKRVRNGKVTYVARWRDEADKQHAKSFKRKADADGHEAIMTVNKNKGISVDPATGRTTLSEYVEQRWLPSLVHARPNTLSTYESHLRAHIKPELGDRQLGSLKRPDMVAFVALMQTKVAPRTVRTIFAVLRLALQSAVDDEIVPANPCSRVPLPKIEQRQPKDVAKMPITIIEALAAAMPARYAVTIWIGACTGLRQGEILGLLVPRVDFLRRCFHVEQQMQTANGIRPRLCETKSPASTRTVPVDDVVLEALAQHIAKHPPGPDGLLITNRLGQPVRRSSFGHCWRKAVEEVGLPKGTRFHDLRHWYAGKLINADVHLKKLQILMGHDSSASTDVYSYLYVETEDAGRGTFDGIFQPDGDSGRGALDAAFGSGPRRHRPPH